MATTFGVSSAEGLVGREAEPARRAGGCAPRRRFDDPIATPELTQELGPLIAPAFT